MPVIINENRSDKPSRVKPRFTPKEGTHSKDCRITPPREISPMNVEKYTNKDKGMSAARIASLPRKIFPLTTKNIEKIKPNNIAKSMRPLRM
ncbi:MAG: hypothetical protein ACI8YP_001005 [Algoriphagus sp.]